MYVMLFPWRWRLNLRGLSFSNARGGPGLIPPTGVALFLFLYLCATAPISFGATLKSARGSTVHTFKDGTLGSGCALCCVTTAERQMRKSDLLAHAAECERALQVATEPEQRRLLQQLRSVWLGLARERSMARDPEMQEAIAALRHLHSEIAAVRPTLH
jgi:hypothetical protein